MARLVATAFLLFSLLAVANCRVREAYPEELGTANSVVSQEADAAEVVIPATVAAGEGFLGLPSHQRHRHRHPCRHGHGLFHRHLWWARHHGLSHRHGDARADNDDLTVGLPMEVAHEVERKGSEQEETEVQAVAEPDPDSRPDTDGEHEDEEAAVMTFLGKEQEETEVQAVAEPDPDSRPDIDGEHEAEEAAVMPLHGEEQENDGETMKAWKVEMLRRFRHGLRFHHHRHDDDDEEDQEDGHEHGKEGAGATKRLFHFHHHDEDGEEEMTSKRFQFHQSDNVEKEGEEETARHWNKAMTRGRLHHGRRHHHHRHHADEEAEKDGGVMKWFMDLVNRF